MSKSEQILKISPGRTQKFPKDWKLQSLDEVSDVIDPYPSHRAPKLDPEGVPYLGIGDLDEEGNIVKISRYVSPTALEEQKETFSLKKGDLALGRVASIGKVVKLNPKQDYTISPTLAIIQPKIKSDFLRQVILGSYFQEQLKANVKGSTRSAVGIQTVRKLIIGIPNESEIEKISTILTNFDKLISYYIEMKLNSKKLKNGLIQLLLSEKYHNEEKINVKLGKIVKFSSGEFLPKEKQSMGKIPIYGGNGIIDYHNKFMIDFSTIVFGRVGAQCGSIHLTEGKSWITDNAIYIKDFSDELEIEYLYSYLKKLNINSLAEISAQPKISQSILENIEINFPKNKKMQKQISVILSNIDFKIQHLELPIKNIKNLKKGLMQNLLTGQIRVSV